MGDSYEDEDNPEERPCLGPIVEPVVGKGFFESNKEKIACHSAEAKTSVDARKDELRRAGRSGMRITDC